MSRPKGEGLAPGNEAKAPSALRPSALPPIFLPRILLNYYAQCARRGGGPSA